MKMINTSGQLDGIGYDAPVTSGVRALGFGTVRERSLASTDVPSTGEVRPQVGAVATAAMTPTADTRDPARVRSWSPPV